MRNQKHSVAGLGQLISERAILQPDRLAFRFYGFSGQGPSQDCEHTYRSLMQHAADIAARLRSRAQPGGRVLIVCPPGLDYVTSFLACQLAGLIAVPAYPPRNFKHMERLEAILADADAALIVCLAAQIAKLDTWLHARRDLTLLAVDEISQAGSGQWEPVKGDPDAIAFLQYTSGTTGVPKGVMVSHRQVIENLRRIDEMLANGCREPADHEHAMCGWLPPYHDLGLIGTILYPLYAGIPSHLMQPAAFVQKPGRWLDLISRTRSTLTMAPNFAYQLCCDEIPESDRARLDLSSLQYALNAAEPVQKKTLDAFSDLYAAQGFRASAFAPAYGMAECVLMATSSWAGPASSDKSTVEVGPYSSVPVSGFEEHGSIRGQSGEAVSCGHSLGGQALAIVDPQTCMRLKDKRVGEIWLSGSSIASGYWNRPELTKEVFKASMSGETDGQEWLRTGDLGAVIDGQLYILGRRKEMVIIRGQNFYAVDLEVTANSSDPALGNDRTIAFGTEREGEEQLVLVHELSRSTLRIFDPGNLARAMRQAVLDAHEVDVSCVVFIRPASLPRSTAGKLQRLKARFQYLNADLSEIARWEAGTDVPVLTDPGIIRRFGGLDRAAGSPHVSAVLGTLEDLPGCGKANAIWYLDGGGQARLRVAVTRAETGLPQTGLAREGDGRMRFGLFFFGSDDPKSAENHGYDLLLEAGERADEAGLEAVWTPERHFGEFGGHYPNPVVTSAALAARTRQISIRAGSVVLPLHHVVRIAEDWAMIDNLSGGRVGFSIAAGWHARDFILMPGGYKARTQRMMEMLPVLRALWRGEEVDFSNGSEVFSVRIRPLPVQEEIPVWFTAAGNPQSFVDAGANQLNLLTFLARTSPQELGVKIDAYLNAFAEAGQDTVFAKKPHVSVMVHTFLAGSASIARAQVAEPMRHYIRQATDLVRSSRFETTGQLLDDGKAGQAVIDNAVPRFLETRGLFGSPKDVLERVNYWQSLGIDELACLIDFGLPAEKILTHLSYLFELDQLVRKQAASAPAKVRKKVLAARVRSRLKAGFPELSGLLDVTVEGDGDLDVQNLLKEIGAKEEASGDCPNGPLEELVADCFAEVLKQERIYRDTDFFQKGGSSLHVARLAGRLQEKTGFNVPLQLVFEAPTVRRLAAELEKCGRESVVPLAPVDRSGPVPLSWQQESLWFLDRLDARAGVAYNEIHVFKVLGQLDKPALRQAFDHLAQRHESMRSRFIDRDGVPYQVVDLPETSGFRFEYENLSACSEEVVAERISDLRLAPFDLKNGPVFRAHLLDSGDGQQFLVFGGHHSVRDGWSDAILLKELSALYLEA
ncbi:MupA/Atu3671 family FMN-dependent luciferase-like monooxygenase, partial [Roseibium sp. RKSG952]|uniref:MupA/Atu3671 family FMN-dependent luciferase-like monooxygenase n=1 Tax=Roseibium sp. RKSG952 TaxID=2529384 RepID=UPI0012BC56A0